MPLQGGLLVEPFGADCTNEWTFSSVNSFVNLQIALLVEPFRADFTNEWSLSCVNNFVRLQMLLLAEPFVADVTDEWLFSCVNNFVPLQSRWSNEPFATNFTDVRPVTLLIISIHHIFSVFLIPIDTLLIIITLAIMLRTILPNII